MPRAVSAAGSVGRGDSQIPNVRSEFYFRRKQPQPISTVRPIGLTHCPNDAIVFLCGRLSAEALP